jgi:peptidoglycan/xylan/chitin deacetylase (PgdA/CDA1 family)
MSAILRAAGRRCQSLPTNLLATQHTLLEGFNVTGDWSAANGASLAADTTHVKEGVQSLEITTAEGADGRATKPVNLDLSAAASFRISFYTTDADLSSVKLTFANDAGCAKYASKTLSPALGWNTFSVAPADFTTGGGFSWSSAVIRLRIVVYPKTGTVATAAVDNLTAGVLGTPVLLICFDDNHHSIFDAAYPAMRAYNMRGTAYIITAQIAAANKMTVAQMQALDRDGWDLANHTDSHTNLTTLSQAEQEAELTTAQGILDALELTRASKHVAYPLGAYNDDTLAAMAAAGMLTGRCGLNDKWDVLPPSHLYYLQTKGHVTETTTLAGAKAGVDAIVAGGAIGVLLFHQLVDSAPLGSEQWLISDFQELVAYIAGLGLPCITISELYRLLSGPVSIPRTTP